MIRLKTKNDYSKKLNVHKGNADRAMPVGEELRTTKFLRDREVGSLLWGSGGREEVSWFKMKREATRKGRNLRAVYGHPIAVKFGATLRAARPEGGGFGLRTSVGLAEHFAAGGVVKARRDSCCADGRAGAWSCVVIRFGLRYSRLR